MALFFIKQFALDLLFPKLCFGCKTEGSFLCDRCRALLYMSPPSCFVCKRWVPETSRLNPGRTCAGCQKKTAIYSFFSPFLFQTELIRAMIHALKYQRVRALDEVFGSLLADYFKKFDIELPLGTLCVPIPLHKKRQRTRGFNQSELLAHSLGKYFNIEAATNILKKEKNTAAQVELSAEDRRKNMDNAFRVAHPELVSGKTILLIDDVKTTGATIEAAARALKNAGAAKIFAVTIAH